MIAPNTAIKTKRLRTKKYISDSKSSIHFSVNNFFVNSTSGRRQARSQEVFFEYGENGCPEFPIFPEDTSFDYLITEAEGLLGVCLKQTAARYMLGIPCIKMADSFEVGLAFVSLALERTKPAIHLLKMYSENGLLLYENVTANFEKNRECRGINLGYQRHPSPALLARQIDYNLCRPDGVP